MSMGNYEGFPLGFTMALAQNPEAFERFSSMNTRQRQTIAEGARDMRSKAQMQTYVNRIAESGIR